MIVLSRRFIGRRIKRKRSHQAVREYRATLTGLTNQHWRLLTLIAEHGGFTTIQITTLLFNSRPTAVRHLRHLHTAGLLVRATARRDPSHLAHYTISEPGAQALEQRLRKPAAPGSPRVWADDGPGGDA